jgi:sugar phosphate isomerase/epimerase
MLKADLTCSYYTVAGVSPTAGGASPLAFAERVKACAEAGYRGVGVHVRDYVAMKRAGTTDADLRAILADNDMRCTEVEFLVNWFADGEAGERSRRDEETLYQAAEALGAKVMFLTGDLEPGNAVPLDILSEKFAAVCTRAAQRDVTIGLEPCAWSNVGTVDEALRLIDAAGAANAGLFLDVWHLYRRGYDYRRLADLQPQQIVGVQLDDALAQPRGDDIVADCLDYRVLPGRGDADAAGFLAALERLGVACPISVEVISLEQRGRPLAEAARASFQAARRLLGG